MSDVGRRNENIIYYRIIQLVTIKKKYDDSPSRAAKDTALSDCRLIYYNDLCFCYYCYLGLGYWTVAVIPTAPPR